VLSLQLYYSSESIDYLVIAIIHEHKPSSMWPYYLLLLLSCCLFVKGLAPEYIAGQRCLLSKKSTTRRSVSQQQELPLVVCVGMAQTVTSWEHHLQQLSSRRDVLLYEAAGLGPEQFQQDFTITDVSLPSQAARLIDTIRTAFATDDDSPVVVDLAGFSLGGRIAMAAACEQPDLIRKLHCTGVAYQRSEYGHLQLSAWKKYLQHGNLRAFGQSAVLASYTAAFLKQQESRVPSWIQGVCDNHKTSGLLALMEQTHAEEGPWSVAGMAERLLADGRCKEGRLLVGECDLMAPMDQVQALAAKLQWEAPTIVPGVGHAVPMEAPRAWRDDLLAYLGD
jgi:pimeloyl-ACP methyl ester carboxylesterase